MTPETYFEQFYRSLIALLIIAILGIAASPFIVVLVVAWCVVLAYRWTAGAFAELGRDFKRIMKGG